ncbi:MAG: ABC transporter substrate-binding protein [Gemmataceae bacterium]
MRTLGHLALSLIFFSLAIGSAQTPTKRGEEEKEDPKAKRPAKPPINLEEDNPVGVAPPARVLVVAVPKLPDLMSPTYARTDAEKFALDLLFEPLVRPVYDSLTGRGYEPALATELPRLAVRGRDVRLADAVWSDGSRVTSADVRATLAKLRARGTLESDAVEAVHTGATDQFLTHFKAGTADPLTLLTFKVLPAARADDEGFARNPIGSGPFTYNGRQMAGGREYAIFNANPAYAQRVPNRPRLAAVWMVASRNPAADFRAGKVHFALTERTVELVRQVAPAAAGATNTGGRIEVNIGGGRLGALPSRRIYYLAINHTNVPDPAIRQAIAYAIPREAILATVFRGGYTDHHKSLDGPFPPGTWPCNPQARRLDDADLARDRATVRKDRPPIELSLKYPAEDPLAEKACQEIVRAFEGGSYGVTLRAIPVAADLFEPSIVRAKDYQLAYRHHDYEDEWFNPIEVLGPRTRVYTMFKPSTEFDRLLRLTESRRDFRFLQESMQRLHRDFATEMPFVPLWSLDVHAMIDSRLTTDPLPSLIDPLAPFAKIANWSLQ